MQCCTFLAIYERKFLKSKKRKKNQKQFIANFVNLNGEILLEKQSFINAFILPSDIVVIKIVIKVKYVKKKKKLTENVKYS